MLIAPLLDRLARCQQEMEREDIWKRRLSGVQISDAYDQHSALEIETQLLWNSFASAVPVKLSNIDPFDTKTLSDEIGRWLPKTDQGKQG